MKDETIGRTTCCVVGGGPAGMVLGLLLARAGVRVTVLEKHADFLRDFRGDTVHASTLNLLDELGLGEQFAALPQRRIELLQAQFGDTPVTLGDVRRIPGRHRYIALVPQWDLLSLLASAAAEEPTFTLRMSTEALGVVRDTRGRIGGVRYRGPDGVAGTLEADLVVACDGRGSAMRAAAGKRARSFGVPMDVWWFRLPRVAGDLDGLVGRFGSGGGAVLIDRGDYWQCAFLIPKGADAKLRTQGLEVLHRTLADFVPWLADRVTAITSWDEVKLLEVRLDRLRTWWTDGLLCIGDAAHAMSPAGGVGINLAVQDAVAAARILAGPLRRGAARPAVLAKVQARRWLPTALTQLAQRGMQAAVLGPALAGRLAIRQDRLPLPLRLLQRFPALQGLPGRAVAIGVLPEHAPEWARRSPSPTRTG
jgi:2-polyprenyl-6-methoxyphenol hydroxylase-like FAD-dependent oxidoreductase